MEGHEVVSLGGVGHGELSEGFFGLTLITTFMPFKILIHPLNEMTEFVHEHIIYSQNSEIRCK